MGIIGWSALYLAFAVFCYYILYADAADRRFRLKIYLYENASLWQDFIAYNKSVLELLALDFLKIHCPWSKEVSIRYRVQDARSVLRYMTHEKGWTVADCDNPANHRQIAKDCFQSRIRFWTTSIFALLTSPLHMVILLGIVLVAMIVISIVSAGQRLLNLFRR